MWLPWQRFVRQTQKNMSNTSTPQFHHVHQVSFQFIQNCRSSSIRKICNGPPDQPHADSYTRWPRKNAPFFTLNYNKMNDWMKLLFVVFDRKTFQILFNTMIINFCAGVLTLWSFSEKLWFAKCATFATEIIRRREKHAPVDFP